MSIPLIIFGSTLLMKVMDRFPIIITLGAALLGFLAGEMLVSDPAVAHYFTSIPRAEWVFGALGAALVVALGKYMVSRGRPSAA